MNRVTERMNRKSRLSVGLSLIILALAISAAFAGGLLVGHSYGDQPANTEEQSYENQPAYAHTIHPTPPDNRVAYDQTETYYVASLTDGHEVIISVFPNPQKVRFFLPDLIAPQFFVGNGMISRGYEVFLNDPEKWDPQSIGVEKALDLIAHIQRENREVTEAYAEQTELSVIIGMDFVSRKDEIIESILQSICDHYGWTTNT